MTSTANLSFAICVLFQIFFTGVNGDCYPTPVRRKLQLGVYYTKSYYQEWASKSKGQDALTSLTALADLAEHKWFKMFSPNYTNYETGKAAFIHLKVEEKNVQQINDSVVAAALKLGNIEKAAQSLCPVIQKMKKPGQDWDFPVIFIHGDFKKYFKYAYETAYSGNLKRGTSFCKVLERKNCGIIFKWSEITELQKTFNSYYKVLAVVIGKALGLKLAKRNIDEVVERNWASDYEMALINRVVDPNDLLCLSWKCGGPNLDDMLSRYKRPYLDTICESRNDDGIQYRVFPKRISKLKLAAIRNRKKRKVTQKSFRNIILKNPEFYKKENVCKGIPCIPICYKGQRCPFYKKSFGMKQEDMTYRYCGSNSVCVKGVCTEYPELDAEQKAKVKEFRKTVLKMY